MRTRLGQLEARQRADLSGICLGSLMVCKTVVRF
jgi:hypothetical protein